MLIGVHGIISAKNTTEFRAKRGEVLFWYDICASGFIKMQFVTERYAREMQPGRESQEEVMKALESDFLLICGDR